MFRLRLSRPTPKSRAQAMVEFALTAMLLLLLLTMIIEVARIFQAYVTLQGAARAGARYAITGQWYDKYAGDPFDPVPATAEAGLDALTSGWDKNEQGNPYKKIAPCWPRFSAATYVNDFGDPVTDDYSYTYRFSNPADPTEWFEPYRDARTCSIEENVIRGMTGLALNIYDSGGKRVEGSRPHYECCYMDKTKPNTYQIEVLGYTANKYPHEGNFTYMIPDPPEALTPDLWSYGDYSLIKLYDREPAAGLVRGYGGDPGQKVVVRVSYNLGLITPLLNRLIPTIPLQGTAIMTNEQFGSFGVQSNAVLPPALPDLPPLTESIPPDLIVSTFTGPEGYGSSSPGPGDPVSFNFVVTNQGGADTVDTAALKLYFIQTSTPPTNPTPENFTGGPTLLPGVVEVGSAAVPDFLTVGSSTPVLNIGFAFPDGGTYYLYAVVDANYQIDEEGFGSIADPARETNNVAGPIMVVVTSDADLVLSKTVDNKAPAPGDDVAYSISVTNLGGAIAKNIVINDAVPAPLTYRSSNAPGASTYNSSTGDWTIPTLNMGATITLTLVGRVPSTTAIGTSITNTVASLTMDSSLNDPDSTNDIGCTNGCKSATIVVGAINLELSKTISGVPSAGPIENTNFNYTLTVKNLSSVTAANNVTIVDTLPTGITYASGPTDCDAVGQIVTCTVVPPLAPKATVTRTITVFAATGSGGKTLTNTATVSADEVDPDLDDNTDSVSVLVQSVDIEIKKTVSPLYIPTNNNFTWTVTVKNLGPNTANTVVIEDIIPTAQLVSTPTPSVSKGSWNSTTMRWTIPTLAVNDSATMTFVAQAQLSADGATITNTATFISADKTDVNSANNSASSGVNISNAPAADIQLDKSVSPTSAGPDDEIVYTFTVTNNGPLQATGVTITDTSLSTNTTNSSLTSFFNYTSIPSAWNPTTGRWNVGTLNAGQSKTYSLTLKLNGDSTTPVFTNTATAASGTTSYLDQDSSNNTDTADLEVLWPKLIFYNVGGAGCNPVTWGTSVSDPVSVLPRNWIQTEMYTPGGQGIYGSKYTLNPPVTGFTFVDGGGAPINADGQNLMACKAVGRSFGFQYDNLATGLYEITLVFADPGIKPGERRFSVNASANKVKTGRILKNFDVALALGSDGTSPAKYYVKTYQYRVKNAKKPYLKISFVKGRGGSKSYKNTDAIVNGIGITYLNP